MRYDDVIVGGGSAGCVLAARLSADPARTVLLLEAGPDYPEPRLLPPELSHFTGITTTHDWGYAAAIRGLGRAIPLPRGKVMGGCSAVNATMAVRGATPWDYDEWAALGNEGWSFAEVLPYFRRLETDADDDGAAHGKAGPIPIRRVRPDDGRVQRAFLSASAEAGFPLVEDHNAVGAIGAGPIPTNGYPGIRQSAALTYLAAVRHRPNLTIRSDVLVDRVRFEGQRATGVRLAEDEEEVQASRVLLAAGAYGSPTILLRSGIGPGDDLRGLGIDVAADVPGVGQGLVDHPFLAVTFGTPVEPPAPHMHTLLTCPSTVPMKGFDLHILACITSIGPTGLRLGLGVSVVKPASRGSLRLQSSDPAVPPVIDPGYLSDPGDIARMVRGVEITRALACTPSLAALLGDEVQPGPRIERGAGLEEDVLARVETYHHPVGTCHMGPPTDHAAVVDAKGKVRGVEGLWVIDASIMPTIPAGNTNLPTMMLAERCAAWLTEDA